MCIVVIRACGSILVGAAATSLLYAGPADPKAQAAAEYVGHVTQHAGTRFVIHIDSFTPDDEANAVALAGREGNSNAIRKALGRLDAGYVKLGSDGYRIAYARRHAENDGVRMILIIRNEMTFVGRVSTKDIERPPLAAVDVWIPSAGDGQARISGAATVVFRSADDVEITDWGGGPVESFDLRKRRN
jgi:hypothetical protein